tara:strand:+ start:265 stop:1761 length:1497 start_codon:yes stop_codon:yes gene_type:complete
MRSCVHFFSNIAVHAAFICCVALFVSLTPCRADYTLYTLPGSDLSIMLEGSVTYNPGGTATHRHPRGSLYFNAKDIQVLKLPTNEAVFAKKLREATQSKDVDTMLETAKWALHNGLLDECKSLLSAAWKLDSSHAKIRKLAGLMYYLNRPVTNNSTIEANARELVGGKSMQLSRSKHFFLLHDGDNEKDPRTRKTRPEMRLELLEKVYESYFLTFAFEGLFLRPPTDPLAVVLFSQHADFMQMEKRLGMGLRQVAGFYLPKENISIFYDSGTTPMFQQLQKLNEMFDGMEKDIRRNRMQGGGELIRFANTIELLIDIERESEDVSVVSHEAVHQLAGNTDLFPSDGVFVRWVHEGLASFFESSKMARWSGVGVVDRDRIAYYRVLEGDPIRGGIEFIVSDLGFTIEGMLGNQLPAYGQAWALTHFLFHERFDQLIKFYREIQNIDIEVTDAETLKAKAEKLVSTFDECFGDRTTLELEWRRYMRSLRTDMERLAEEIR